MLPVAGVDEDCTLSRLRGLRSDLIDPAIDAHHGRIVKRTGDGSLIEFRSVVDAVRCAIEVTAWRKAQQRQHVGWTWQFWQFDLQDQNPIARLRR